MRICRWSFINDCKVLWPAIIGRLILRYALFHLCSKVTLYLPESKLYGQRDTVRNCIFCTSQLNILVTIFTFDVPNFWNALEWYIIMLVCPTLWSFEIALRHYFSWWLYGTNILPSLDIYFCFLQRFEEPY